MARRPAWPRAWCAPGLAGQYPAFTTWLALDAAKSIALISIPPATLSYAWAWLISQPIILVLQIGAVAEVFGHTTRAYPLIGTFGRWVLIIGLTVAIAAAAAPLVAELGTAGLYGDTRRFLGFELKRIVSMVLAVFLLAVLAAFAVVPIPERKNVRLHRILLTVYHAVNAGAMLYVTIAGPAIVARSSAIILSSSVVLYGLWCVGMTRAGEHVDMGPTPSAEEINLAEAYLAETLPALKRMARHPFRPRA